VTIGRDQLRALAVLRYWFGDLEVLAVLEREGSRGGATLPFGWPASQLALATDDQVARVDPPSRPAVRPSRRDAKRP
jgi:hypothetical protein